MSTIDFYVKGWWECEENVTGLKVKCPDCVWSQFEYLDAVGMTPCPRCNSTGYIVEPLVEEVKND